MRRLLGAAGLALALVVAISPAVSAASPQPAWMISLTSAPAQLAPGGAGKLLAKATNVGGEATAGSSALSITLPPGLTATGAYLKGIPGSEAEHVNCPLSSPSITCETSVSLPSSRTLSVTVNVEVDATPPSAASVQTAISGGGGEEASSELTVPLQGGVAPFGFLTPLQDPLLEEGGAASTLAGSHPYEQALDFEFPTQQFAGNPLLFAAGHAKDVRINLPPGLIADPAATPVLCNEDQLESDVATGGAGCPDGSALGTLDATIQGGTEFGLSRTQLYNMVPPPGYPAELGTDVAGVGLYLHILPSVRSEGDYGITAEVPDLIALKTQPVFGSRSQLWGDPSSPLHDRNRGVCLIEKSENQCPVEAQQTAFWTLPAHCDGQPLTTAISANSWEEPDVFVHSSYESASLGGSPVAVGDCASLEFEPTIDAKPTTNLADSPSGLDFDLHQPQDTDKEERSNPPLRDAAVTLPDGMAVNPSQADGLGACTEQQIGYLAEAPEAGIHFDKTPNSCPDAAKLGTVEVTTPLLVQRDASHKLELDPETHLPIPRPLHGAVYLAEPFHNPFGSLLAIYLTVEDPESGTFAKLAGQIEPDPETGQLTTVFRENPQLPIEDIRLHLFGGARGSLITPPTCGTHATGSDLESWSAPEIPDASPSSSFQTSAEPGGGPCPTSSGAAPNAPGFLAGTLTPQAGAYSPFVLKVSREDGSQRLAGIDTTLPPGLTGKLAGIPACSDAQIAQAQARSRPEEGRLEREAPSCPPATEVGSVVVGAGAGPTPYYTTGRAYLAGPYKGAPLSLAIITPAIAGPFDLGTVVTRVALHVEPETAQIHAVSDPLPQILDGIPLDVRSVALTMDRPNFVLNPTSCNPMAIAGTATSTLGQPAALSTPFQVGGCSALAFKPKLSLALKGSVKRSSNPRLIATLKAKPGEANVARAQVKLPHAVFLDQAHIRTVCTRVQFAADACPAGSVYGRAEATTPLLGYPLSGSVYLRSNPAHLLPDLVAKLKGPASQPIEIDLAGKTDAVKAALRNTFEAVPDAPVSSFRLELFGGKRGLVEMSDGFCKNRRATVQLEGQNGKAYDTRPVVAAKCAKPSKGHRHGGGGKRGGR
jgi:hypothetical protein